MKQHRFFDREHASWVRRLLPGEFGSSRKAIKDPAIQQRPEALMTVLGSCVAVCLTDKVEGVIGMNHFMLPQQTGSAWIENGKQDPANRSARYGSYAMELLINELLAQGAKKDRLAAWIFGGGQILSSLSDIGRSNVEFARRYLVRENIAVQGQDTGGTLARKLYFSPSLKAPECIPIQESLSRIQHRELRLAAALASNGVTQKSDISLFDRA
jgi:chemotaxis protein CheD